MQELKLVSIITSLTARSLRFHLSSMNGSHNLVVSLTKIQLRRQFHDMIYLLTEIVFPPGGSSTVHSALIRL